MKLTEITKKTDAELTQLLIATRAELAQAVLDSRTKETKDVKQQGRLKTTIARTLTITREREIAKMEAAQ
jgi:ribosomal protein L29